MSAVPIILQRTWKREVALVLLATLIAVLIRVVFFVAPEDVASYQPLIGAIAFPILTYLAAAFWMQAWQQQVAQKTLVDGTVPHGPPPKTDEGHSV